MVLPCSAQVANDVSEIVAINEDGRIPHTAGIAWLNRTCVVGRRTQNAG